MILSDGIKKTNNDFDKDLLKGETLLDDGKRNYVKQKTATPVRSDMLKAFEEKKQFIDVKKSTKEENYGFGEPKNSFEALERENNFHLTQYSFKPKEIKEQ